MQLQPPIRVLLIAWIAALPVSLSAGDWPQFRGPGSRATSDASGLPVQWSERSGLCWKVELPGPGSSSPIVVGERVFVTCYSGYGPSAEAPGEMEHLCRHLLCVDLSSGEIAWQRDLPAALPEANYVDFMPQHGYATSTPASDGRLVYEVPIPDRGWPRGEQPQTSLSVHQAPIDPLTVLCHSFRLAYEPLRSLRLCVRFIVSR